MLEFPLGIFGVALGTVILPHLSGKHAAQDPEGFTHSVDWGLRLGLFIALPAAVFLVPSDIPFTAHDGDSGLATAVIQTDFWSDNRLECAQMRAAARADLNGFTGVIGDLHLSVVETGSSPDYNPDLTLKRSITEWRVMYREAVQ